MLVAVSPSCKYLKNYELEVLVITIPIVYFITDLKG